MLPRDSIGVGVCVRGGEAMSFDQSKLHRFTVIIPKVLYHKLLEVHLQKKLEGDTRATMSTVVREALEAYLQNSPKRES